MSGDPQQDYFSDGLSEAAVEFAGRHSGFTGGCPHLVVQPSKARMTMWQTLRTSSTSAQCSRAACARTSNHLRITVQLIDATTGFHVWSKTYDRGFEKRPGLQAEIAEAVTKSLEATLLADAVATIEIGGTESCRLRRLPAGQELGTRSHG